MTDLSLAALAPDAGPKPRKLTVGVDIGGVMVAAARRSSCSR